MKTFDKEHNDSKCKDKQPLVKTFVQLTSGHWVIDRRKATTSVYASATLPLASIHHHHTTSLIGKLSS